MRGVDWTKKITIALAGVLFCGGLAWAEEEEKDKDASEFKGSVFSDFQNARKGRGSRSTATYQVRRAIPVPKFSWEVDETKPITRMEVRLKEQKAYGYQGEKLVMVTDVSSGREGFATKLGSYTVLEKDKNHHSSLFGSFVSAQGKVVNLNAEAGQKPPEGCHYEPSPMFFFLRLSWEGLGLHAGFLPGYAASHGCVRLPHALAEKLFKVVPLGTPVEVIP